MYVQVLSNCVCAYMYIYIYVWDSIGIHRAYILILESICGL